MERYGAAVIEIDDPELEVEYAVHGRYGQTFRSPFAGLTAVLVSPALGIGVVQYGSSSGSPRT